MEERSGGIKLPPSLCTAQHVSFVSEARLLRGIIRERSEPREDEVRLLSAAGIVAVDLSLAVMAKPSI
jgi:hypothetical protein